jgi:cytochrome P450
VEIEIPNEKLTEDDIKQIFESVDVQKRGNNYFREAIRYFHEPFEIHQENLENGELHKKLQSLTFSIFKSTSKERVTRIAEQKVREWIDKFETPLFSTNLVDEIRSVIVRFFYEIIWENNPPETGILSYLQSARNLHKTLKGEELRSLAKHLRMYEDIKHHLETPCHLKWVNKENLNLSEREILAKHLGGVFFQTGVIQTTELICHTLVEIYRTPALLDKIRLFVEHLSGPLSLEEIEKFTYLDYVLNESLRLFPEIGKTNREVTKRFTIKDITLEEGSVVYLNFLRSHQLYWDDPLTFKPERWDNSSPDATPKQIRDANFMPFGLGARRCPAEAFSRNATKVAIVTIIKYVNLTIPENFVHTRRLVGGVPTIIELNACGQAFRPYLPSNTVSVRDLVARLGQSQRSAGKIDELPGLTFMGSVLKIANNFKDYKFLGIVTFYPLITGAHIWLSFQVKRIKRYFKKLSKRYNNFLSLDNKKKLL